MTITANIEVGTTVRTAEGDEAFVRRIDAKSARAVLVFLEGEALGAEAMRRLTTLTPVKFANGRVRKIKDVKAAVLAARAGELVR